MRKAMRVVSAGKVTNDGGGDEGQASSEKISSDENGDEEDELPQQY